MLQRYTHCCAALQQKTVVEVKGETREALIFQFPTNVLITGSAKVTSSPRSLFVYLTQPHAVLTVA
jgi:hypothetical protein